jgi:hypothetical protein
VGMDWHYRLGEIGREAGGSDQFELRGQWGCVGCVRELEGDEAAEAMRCDESADITVLRHT